jgi:hypothetical protein
MGSYYRSWDGQQVPAGLVRRMQEEDKRRDLGKKEKK